MLEPGDAVPHFQVHTVDGDLFRYERIWQQEHLVLVILSSGAGDSYAAALRARLGEFRERRCECVITREPVAGVAAPVVLVADKWGEIVHIAAAAQGTDLPTPDELLQWIDYVQQRCPECEGEAR